MALLQPQLEVDALHREVFDQKRRRLVERQLKQPVDQPHLLDSDDAPGLRVVVAPRPPDVERPGQDLAAPAVIRFHEDVDDQLIAVTGQGPAERLVVALAGHDAGGPGRRQLHQAVTQYLPVGDLRHQAPPPGR